MALSISLSIFHFGIFLFCPLWDLFFTLGAILYILQEYRRSFTVYKGTHIKRCNYHDANVCLCQGSRICNDTSASCNNDLGQGPTSMRLIDQAISMYDMKIKS